MWETAASAVRLLVLDVDGVLTDGRIVLDDRGVETKYFHVRDGQGLKLLQDSGIQVVLITGRRSEVVGHRARELGIDEVHQGVGDKVALLLQIIRRKGIEKEEVCVVGDDLPDLPMFQVAGMSVAVSDAAPELREHATMVTKNRGGRGAVREVCELILKAQGKWTSSLSAYLPGDEM
ncbi:MAG: HAD-IIIA family hydrolase [Deltaproteobacteria bacterium]|nr:HAD-IIIA family hydrolase [Deltaproteobacteria bacterium]MBW2016390.1 HAD-IIIA family hydrolase [Deltaproteobacteria bacterium]MBW2129710.1 HAD-IIIA family hydrolase [Deltaproteobacteria bacterium]MBW2304931.1 HAD-IIIA family hydrolase [Deltaproteobacteria bacterium]